MFLSSVLSELMWCVHIKSERLICKMKLKSYNRLLFLLNSSKQDCVYNYHRFNLKSFYFRIEQTADRRQQTSHSSHQIVSNKQQTEDRRQHTAYSRHHKLDNTQQTSHTRQHTADSRQHSTYIRLLTVDSRKQIADLKTKV